MVTETGNNAEPTYVSNTEAIKAQLQAQIAEGAKTLTPIAEGSFVQGEPQVQATATESASEQALASSPVTPAEAKKVDSLQQFRGKDGEVDPAKIERSNEHLEKSIQTKEERLKALVETNKELMRKHTKVSQDLKSVQKTAEEDELTKVAPGKLSPELKKKILEDLERDPAETILRLTDAATRRNVEARLSPLEETIRRSSEESVERGLLDDLDRLGQGGHPWVYTQEGRQKFDEFFAENPWVLQSKNPYSSAVKLMGIEKVGTGSQAQVAPKAPTLGSFHAAPPPTTTSPATAEAELSQLSRNLQSALTVGDMNLARTIRLKMDILHRQMMPDAM